MPNAVLPYVAWNGTSHMYDHCRPTQQRRFHLFIYQPFTPFFCTQVGQNVAGTVSAPLQVAQVLSFLKPQGATAYLGYLNNLAAEGIATLDVEVSIKAIANSSRRILFAPTKLK